MKGELLEFYDYHVQSVLSLTAHIQKQDFDLSNQEELLPVLEILNHIYFADKYWFSIIRCDEADVEVTHYRLLEFEQAYKSLHIKFREFLIQLQDTSVPIAFVNRSGNRMVNTITEIIFTVVNHGTYHRGNVSILLRNIGRRSTSSDYAFYLCRSRNIIQ